LQALHHPVDTHAKLSADGLNVADPTHSRSIAGSLQRLTFTRPDNNPHEPHLGAMKRILRYLQGTLDLGLHLHRTTPADLPVYTDVDWGGMS
jgi:hypothetical protein